MVVIMMALSHVNYVSLKSPCINTVRTQMNAVTQRDLFAIQIENSVTALIWSTTIGPMLAFPVCQRKHSMRVATKLMDALTAKASSVI